MLRLVGKVVSVAADSSTVELETVEGWSVRIAVEGARIAAPRQWKPAPEQSIEVFGTLVSVEQGR